ncbi:cytochrome P450 [Paenibacillaceae bacterium]|nr:cytochrome P450 [Paenibacillaceae bacterium]
MKLADSSIPQPKTYGPLGNLPLIDIRSPTLSLCKLAEEMGPIYRLKFPGGSALFVSGHRLVADACDVSRFDKYVYSELENVRAFGGDGLFTSRTSEPNWQKAHNILLPTFSQQAMKGYHTMMIDIAQQLIQKWTRLNPNEQIDVPDDMTRLTLDTIGLCGFNYRFNSYYRESHNPFIISMVRALNEAMHKSNRLKIQNFLMVGKRRQFDEDVQTMFSLVDQIIEERKASGDKGELDLLARMLNSRDPETGEKLDDENIRYQIITFLIAGHETTSGLLSFAIYFLLKNPEALRKAYREVDTVLTDGPPTYEETTQLKYIRMILNESLRLWPTAPGFDLYAKEDTMLDGTYPLAKGETVSILLPQLHRDKDAWGADAEEFRPERFEDPDQVPHHAYKPFGNGQRACIGMQFALHEATLVLAMILRNFELIDHTDYQLNVVQTLTIKPGDFYIRAQPRSSYSAGKASGNTAAFPAAEMAHIHQSIIPNAVQQGLESRAAAVADHRPFFVLYGSDLGASEQIARELADRMRTHRVEGEVLPMNEAVGRLPAEAVALIVTASYNGKPPRNARSFITWLEQMADDQLQGIRYAVLGCGDRNWSGTYQSVPRFVDEQLAMKGAERFMARGELDAAGDLEQQLDNWREQMEPKLLHTLGLEWNEGADKPDTALSIRFMSGNAAVPLAIAYGASNAVIVENRELQALDSGRSTRHIEIALPSETVYKEGDHLGVLPRNSHELVSRVLRRYGLSGSDQLILSSEGAEAAHLPLDQPVMLGELMRCSVELQGPATRAQLRELAASTICPPHKRELEALLSDDVYEEQVRKKRLSMLELLEQYEACELPFARFLELLPPLKPRYYSISSSPQVNAEQASLTAAVVEGTAWSGRGSYRGVASGYLAECRPGESIMMFIRAQDAGFQLPDNPLTPIIMVGPGTGIAPFRAFLQARQAMKQQGSKLGEARLYFGCRNEKDFLYRDELTSLAAEGLVTLHTAFSRAVDEPRNYVQHLMAQHAAELIALLRQGGRIYVCGDGSAMAPDVEAALREMYQKVTGTEDEEAKAWLRLLEREGRYCKDVWVGS